MHTTGLSKLTATEAKLFLRDVGSTIYAFGVPVLLLVIFGLIPAFQEAKPEYGGERIIDNLIPVLVGMILVILPINLMPAYLASHRERGVLRKLATTPVRPSMLLIAQLIVNLVLSVLTSIVLVVLSAILFNTPMIPGQILGFVIAFAGTALSAIALGLIVAARAPNVTVALGVGFGLFFPLMFLAGLWTPGPLMPEVVRIIGEYTPLGAGVQAMQAAWEGSFPSPLHLVVLLVYTIVCGLVAAKLFRWE